MKADSISVFDAEYAIFAVLLRMHPEGVSNDTFKAMMPPLLDDGREVFYDPPRSFPHHPAMNWRIVLLREEFIVMERGYGPSGRLNMNFYFLTLSGLQMCRHQFEVRFHPRRNRAIPLPSVILPWGRDVSTLIDIYENSPDDSAVIDFFLFMCSLVIFDQCAL